MEINYLAVLVSAVVSMIIGSVWYGPLFGKQFMHAMGFDALTPEKQAEMKKAMTMTYVVQFIASLVMFYVLARFIGGLGDMTVQNGMTVAFWAWLGFVVPIKLGDALWGGKMSLFWLGAGYNLVLLLVTGAIIGAW